MSLFPRFSHISATDWDVRKQAKFVKLEIGHYLRILGFPYRLRSRKFYLSRAQHYQVGHLGRLVSFHRS